VVALGCVVLLLVITIAGLWYRSAVREHPAKYLTAAITTRHDAVPYGEIPKRLPKPGHVITAIGGASSIAGSAAETAEPVRDRELARSSHPQLPAVSATPSPIAAGAASFDTIGAHLTNRMRPIASSLPTMAVLKNPEDSRSERIVKKDQQLGSTPLSSIPASTLVLPQITTAHTTTGARVPRPAVEGNATPPSAEEMAAYDIRLGNAYVDIGDYEKARLAFSKAIALAPDDKEVKQRVQDIAADQIRLGDAYMHMGDYDKALRSFSRAIAFAPDNQEAQEKMKRARTKAAEENVLQ
jgi:Tetratricopeptide repeat